MTNESSYLYTNNGVDGYDTHNACTVNALSTAANVPWRIAHEALRIAGRKERRGLHSYSAIENKKIPNFEFEKVDFGRDLLGHQMYRMSVAQFIRKNPVGSFYVTKRGHAFAIVDGKVRDWTSQGPRVSLLHAWSVKYVGNESCGACAHSTQKQRDEADQRERERIKRTNPALATVEPSVASEDDYRGWQIMKVEDNFIATNTLGRKLKSVRLDWLKQRICKAERRRIRAVVAAKIEAEK